LECFRQAVGTASAQLEELSELTPKAQAAAPMPENTASTVITDIRRRRVLTGRNLGAPEPGPGGPNMVTSPPALLALKRG